MLITHGTAAAMNGVEHMEVSMTVPGEECKRASLEQHQQEKATLVSKGSIYLGHSSRVEHTAASTPPLPGRRHKKRALELRRLPENDEDDDDDDDEYWEWEPTFVAGKDGAYTDLEMPKRINRGFDVGESWAVLRRAQAQEERDIALRHRHRILMDAVIRDMYAKAAAMANKAAPAPPPRK